MEAPNFGQDFWEYRYSNGSWEGIRMQELRAMAEHRNLEEYIQRRSEDDVRKA